MKQTTFKLCRLGALVLGLWGGAANVSAGLLGLGELLNPDLFSENIVLTYNASTHEFLAVGDASNYTAPDTEQYNIYSGGTFPIFSLGVFNLSAVVDNTGAISGGTVTITGGLYGSGPAAVAPNPVLLTGTLTEMGYQLGDLGTFGTDKFDFRFTVTGGVLASEYGSVAGIILDTQDIAFTDFTGDFESSGAGVSDTVALAVIPEPSTSVLVMMAVVGAVVAARRSRKAVS